MLVAVRVRTAAARVHGMAGAWKRPGRRGSRAGDTGAVRQAAGGGRSPDGAARTAAFGRSQEVGPRGWRLEA